MDTINKRIVIVHRVARWVKPAQPAEPKYLTLTLVMGGPTGDIGGVSWYRYKSAFLIKQWPIR